MTIKISLMMLAVLTFLPSFAHSEEYNRVSFYYVYQNWKLDLPQNRIVQGMPIADSSYLKDQKVNQGVLGLSATGVISEKFHIDLGGTLANTTSRYEFAASANNSEQKLSSLNDTRLRLTYTFAEGKGAGSVFFNLPTGKRELTTSQYGVTSAIADISRKFLVRRYGQGLDIGVDWYALPRWGDFGLDVGGGYVHHGKYQVLKDVTKDYKYGDEIFGKIGFDIYSRPLGGSLDVNARYYTKDKYDGKEIFQAGISTTISAAIIYSDAFDLQLGGAMLIRGKAKVRSASEGVFTDESVKSGRSELLIYANGSVPATEKLRVLGRLEFQNVGANDYNQSDLQYQPKSHYLGFGGGLAFALTNAFSASSLVTYYTGKIDSDNKLTGLGIALVLTFRPGQGR